MTALKWDEVGKRLYETGVSNAVLFVRSDAGTYPLGVAWNGITAITESPSGAESNKLYADNVAYVDMQSAEEFAATIEAYTYPDEFAVCDGSAELAEGVTVGQQTRKAFGLAYKTKLGNDVAGNDLGYKLHLIYNLKAAPSERAYATINDSPEAITLSWEATSTPEPVTGKKPTSCITIDSTKADSVKLKNLEEQLFGRDAVVGPPAVTAIVPNLPLPNAVAAIFAVG